jgi:hypothetical protein
MTRLRQEATPGTATPGARPAGEMEKCPFCGALDGMEVISVPQPDSKARAVHCWNCSAEGPGCDTEAEATQTWNRRAAPPEVERMREALKPRLTAKMVAQLRETVEAERAVGSSKDATALELLLNWHEAARAALSPR